MKVLDTYLIPGTFDLDEPGAVPTTFAWRCSIGIGGQWYMGYGHNALEAFVMAIACYDIEQYL